MKRLLIIALLALGAGSCTEQVNTDPPTTPCECCKNHDCGGFPSSDPMPNP